MNRLLSKFGVAAALTLSLAGGATNAHAEDWVHYTGAPREVVEQRFTVENGQRTYQGKDTLRLDPGGLYPASHAAHAVANGVSPQAFVKATESTGLVNEKDLFTYHGADGKDVSRVERSPTGKHWGGSGFVLRTGATYRGDLVNIARSKGVPAAAFGKVPAGTRAPQSPHSRL